MITEELWVMTPGKYEHWRDTMPELITRQVNRGNNSGAFYLAYWHAHLAFVAYPELREENDAKKVQSLPKRF